MSSDTTIRLAAERIRDAYRTGNPIPPISEMLPGGDIDAAYAIQNLNTQEWITQGRRLVGCKIGLTAQSVQRQLGVAQPDFGMLFADMAMAEGMPIPAGRVLQPKIEAEVALLLGRDLDCERITIADIVRATEGVMPALEIVGSRIANWDIQIVDTIADNASSGLFVLGGPFRKLDGLDLRGARMAMRRGDEIVSDGVGAACLGHPLNAAAWLAAELSRRKRPLSAGDIVLTGALGPMCPVAAGDCFTASISGIGDVAATFAA
jgi:2-keto-4-pentenoate hydratase